MTSENFQTTTIEEVSTVEVCDSCGTDLSDIEPSAREQRVLRDIKFTVEEVKVDAENKDSPTCGARTKGRFPENMPGPLQYGNGIKAFVINLLVTQMVSLNRAVGLVQAMSGIKLSEATCPGYIQRLHDALAWESDTREYLLTRRSLHVDETSLKVDKKTQWMHVATNGFVTLKFLHRKRGKEAIASFGILPVYTVNLLLKVTLFYRPIMTPPAGRKDSWGGAATGPARMTNHPNPFYADHPWLPFHRCPMRRSFYNQRVGSNLDEIFPLWGSLLHDIPQSTPVR